MSAVVSRCRRCELQPFSDRGFDKCLAGRRLIMIGDSTMNGIFSSLACLLRNRIESGRHMPWEVSNITKIQDNIEYMSRGGEAIKQVGGIFAFLWLTRIEEHVRSLVCWVHRTCHMHIELGELRKYSGVHGASKGSCMLLSWKERKVVTGYELNSSAR